MDINATNIAAMPVWWQDNISMGIFLFLLGVTGAAIMVYLGELEKLTGKSSRIIEIEEEIKEKRKIASKFGEDKTDDRKKWEDMINADEDRLDRERRNITNQGIISYLFIGGMIAAVLANSMVEAVGFGAGWTGFIGMFGIKKDSDERRKKRDEIDEKDKKDIEVQILNAYETGRLNGAQKIVEELAKIENTTVETITKKLN
ncbi:MAG: hypothetical protein O8C63_11400 [Candidatus Methanoperedens sp.]|nr:hypothetical protein [Candidatus Methanoperedens sp.]